MKVVALIPAHNEEASIGATVASLLNQTRPPDSILVMCDNCTDDTHARAFEAGASALDTQYNEAKKAGALNQGLRHVAAEYVLVADADTQLAPTFIETAVERLEADPGLGAVGGIFSAATPTNLVERFQANEYARYALELERTGRLMVLSGTASVIRREAMLEVAEQRGTRLPGQRGDFYDRTALTEDNELTLALKTLGWTMESPAACTVVTEVMPDLSFLWKQRLRWYRGAIDNLRLYGFTRTTARYWGQQGMLLLGTFSMALYLTLMSIDVVLGWVGFNPLWMLVGLVFWTERVWTAPSGGKRVAALFVPELLYEIFLQWAFFASLSHVIRNKETGWHHLNAQGATS